MKTFIVWIVVAAFLCSCEKTISFKPKNADQLVVVEAIIESDQYPTVLLSRSQNYFSSISPGQLDSSFIHGADVSISNGTITSRLKEFVIPAGNGYTVSYYTVDSTYPAGIFKGEFGKGYSLQVGTGGKTYTATT